MKKQLLLTGFCLYTLFAVAQPKKNDWQIQEYKGKVKSITEVRYDGKTPDKTITEINLFNERGFRMMMKDSNAEGGSLTQYKYDTKDDMLECIMESKKYPGKTVRKYDEKGNEIETLMYKGNGELENSFKYTFDVNGNQVGESDFDNKGVLTGRHKLTYNTTGKCTLDVEYDAKGAVVGKTTYKYDQEGNKTERVVFDEQGKQSLKDIYTYDKEKREINDLSYGDGEDVFANDTTIYDTYGNVTSRLSKLPGSKDGYINEYKYDAQGNWTSEVFTMIIEGEKQVSYTKRKILYY